ncbi:MAG: hypothetical protein V3T86_04590 [Planctomycetota bacterium]
MAHRLICRRCFTARRKAQFGPNGPEPLIETDEMRALKALDRQFTYVGLGVKAFLYGAIFYWAHQSSTGSAVLDGFVAADILTWIFFGFFEWEYRGFQLKQGSVIEAGLILLYLTRNSLFDLAEGPEEFALTFLSFGLFATIKSTLWAGEHVIQVTGVGE